MSGGDYTSSKSVWRRTADGRLGQTTTRVTVAFRNELTHNDYGSDQHCRNVVLRMTVSDACALPVRELTDLVS